MSRDSVSSVGKGSQYSLGVFFAVIASVVFGMIPLFSVPLMRAGMSVPSIVCYRFALSTVALGVVLVLRRVSFKISIPQFLTFAGLSLFYALTALLLTASYQYIPTGIATTIHFLYPVMVALLTIFIFKGKVSSLLLVAIALAIAGVAMLSLSGLKAKNIDSRGIAIVLATVVTYGSYLAWLPNSRVRGMDGTKITFWLVFNCTWLFALHILVTEGPGGFSAVPDSRCALNLVLLSLLPTLVSNLTLVQAVQRIGSTATSVLGSLEPFTAMLIGIFVFHEHCTPVQVVGVIVVIAAVMLVIAKRE
ncbi:MAG: EamA family transporter [Bacteroidales bacterium]|nr:EamA family transporter [Bacteroidales bacterium]